MPGSVTVDRFTDRWLAGPPVYLADLERCLPGEAMSPAPALRHWRALPFTAEACGGTMLLAGPEDGGARRHLSARRAGMARNLDRRLRRNAP